jgi:hypothetical protein
MGIALAVLVLFAISGGFIALLGLPLVYVWLAYCVYSEPWKEEAPAVTPDLGKPEDEAERLMPPPLEKPRTMAAGRRRPLP